jgi:hypothetical protein
MTAAGRDRVTTVIVDVDRALHARPRHPLILPRQPAASGTIAGGG